MMAALVADVSMSSSAPDESTNRWLEPRARVDRRARFAGVGQRARLEQVPADEVVGHPTR